MRAPVLVGTVLAALGALSLSLAVGETLSLRRFLQRARRVEGEVVSRASQAGSWLVIRWTDASGARRTFRYKDKRLFGGPREHEAITLLIDPERLSQPRPDTYWSLYHSLVLAWLFGLGLTAAGAGVLWVSRSSPPSRA